MSIGDYIVPAVGAVHWRPDPRTATTACGLDLAGTHATTHPITTGEAFTCLPCEQAWIAENDTDVAPISGITSTNPKEQA